jgi:two-component system, OmpR family, phosphate regulon response regulator PhoB
MNVVTPPSGWDSLDHRITIVEPDEVLAETLAQNLRSAGYVVETLDRGDQAVQKLAEAPPDLLIVEWLLPGLSGLEISGRLRADAATQKLPIIMLSSRGEQSLRLRGFSAGVDDFVIKPFSTPELLARVHALLRRTRLAVADDTLARGDLQIDRRSRRVRRGSRDVHLSAKEFRLLEYLLERPGIVFPRQHLLERVWGSSADITERTIDVHIGRLRKALSHGRERNPILTERGGGYFFDESFGKS